MRRVGALLALAASTAFGAPAPDDSLRPGSYTLEHIMAAPDGSVVDADGKTWRMTELTAGKITLLGLIYTRCADPAGCPLTRLVFDRLQRQVGALPTLRSRVQLISLSFDPGHDRPAVLRRYAGDRRDPARLPRWWFLSPGSASELAALLDGFGQDLRRVSSESSAMNVRHVKNTRRSSGHPADAPQHGFSHLPKVFLIDSAGSVREIYSPAFLRPEVILADLQSLRLEEDAARR